MGGRGASVFPKIIDEGRILREDGGKRRGRRFLLESHSMGLHNVSRVESCPVWSYDGTQIEKEIASRLAFFHCVQPVPTAPCG